MYVIKERRSHLFSAQASASGSSTNAVRYKSPPSYPKQLVKFMAVMKNDGEILREGCREEIQLPFKVGQHHPAFLEMFTGSKRIRDSHLQHINDYK